MVRLNRYIRLIVVISLASSVAMSCKRIDDDRIPPVNVNIEFTTEGMWAKYGIGGALEYTEFIRTAKIRQPVDFPFTANTYTGYGGVLLVGDLYGNPLAYDLACPFEVQPDIRVHVDMDALDAACPVCGSTYDVFFGEGRPTSGPSADRGYGLTRYKVLNGTGALSTKLITR